MRQSSASTMVTHRGRLRQRLMKLRWDDDISPYLFLLPALILFGLFVIYPLVYNFRISLYKWDGISPEMKFIALDNYVKAFTDSAGRSAMGHSVLWFFVTVFVQAALGLFLALAFNQRLRGITLFRTIFLIPVALAPALTAIVFGNLYEPTYGQVNEFLRSLGLDSLTQNWLADPKVVIWAIMFVNIWIWTGFSLVMYQAGLTLIPDVLYEAAVLDGASGWQKVRFITIPLLKSTHATLLILGAIGTLKTFDIVFLLSRGGPYHASEMPSNYIFIKSFFESQFGYGSAMAVLLGLIALGGTVFQLRLYRSERES